VQIGVSVVAVVVKTERLALTVVVTLCQCREMDIKEEQRVAIKVDFSATKTVELIQKAYGDAALSRTTIFEWHKRFREGRESVKDDERRYTRHPENCGTTDFKRRFEETTTPQRIRQQ